MSSLLPGSSEDPRPSARAEQVAEKLRRLAAEIDQHGGAVWFGATDLLGLADLLSALQSQQADLERVTAHVSEIRAGEENEGALESTDLFVTGRGISLLVNVVSGQQFTYSLGVDGQERQSGTVGTDELEAKVAALEQERADLVETNQRLNRRCQVAETALSANPQTKRGATALARYEWLLAKDELALQRAELESALRRLADETGCADPDCCQAALDLEAARNNAKALLARLDGEAQSGDAASAAVGKTEPGKSRSTNDLDTLLSPGTPEKAND